MQVKSLKRRNNLRPRIACMGLFAVCLLALPTGSMAAEPYIPSNNDAERAAIAPLGEQLATPPQDTGFAGSFLSSRFARKHKDLDEAAKYAEETLAHDPANVGFLRDALRVAILRGDMDKAISHAAALPKSAEAEPLIASLLMIRAIDEKNHEEAAGFMRDAQARGLFALIQPVVMQWLALSKSDAAQPITMEELTEKAGFFEPFLNYQLALMNDVAGHNDMALRFYKLTAESQEVSPYRVVQALANFYARQAKWNEVGRLIADYKEANPSAVLVPKIPSPKQPLATPMVADAREGLAELYFTTASLLYGEQSALETFWYLRVALHLRPDFAPAQFMLANLYEQIQASDRAVATYDAIDTNSVFYLRGQVRKALNLEALGKPDDAIELLDAIADTHPQDISALTTKGDVLRTQELFDDAANAYSKAIARIGEPREKDWSLFYARGICYERDDEWPRAEADFKQALALSPDQPDVLNYLAYSWLVLNRNLTEARDMLRVAVEARPEDAHIIDSMGWAYYLTGDFARAAEYLERAVELAPQDAAIIDHLGDAYWRLGRVIEAQYKWQRVLQYAKENDPIREAAEDKLREGLPPFLTQQQS